jgi:hypothetical protein
MINDLPEKEKEELRRILREDILQTYHNGDMEKELGEKVKGGLSDEEILVMYDNEGCWNRQIIEEYLIQRKTKDG